MSQMMVARATLEQALEALTNCTSEYGHRCSRCDSEVDEGGKVVEALRSALAQEPAPMPSFPPVSQWTRGCAVCGIGADGKAYAYVCSRHDCPTKITCGGTV